MNTNTAPERQDIERCCRGMPRARSAAAMRSASKRRWRAIPNWPPVRAGARGTLRDHPSQRNAGRAFGARDGETVRRYRGRKRRAGPCGSSTWRAGSRIRPFTPRTLAYRRRRRQLVLLVQAAVIASVMGQPVQRAGPATGVLWDHRWLARHGALCPASDVGGDHRLPRGQQGQRRGWPEAWSLTSAWRSPEFPRTRWPRSSSGCRTSRRSLSSLRLCNNRPQ